MMVALLAFIFALYPKKQRSRVIFWSL